MICNNSELVTFEVFLSDNSQSTIDKASEKLKELVNEVHRRKKSQVETSEENTK